MLSAVNDLTFQELKQGEPNYSYFPVIFESEQKLLEVETALNKKKIYPRRYFYPSVNTYSEILAYQETPISEDVSNRILCLPLFWKLQDDEVNNIARIILKTIR